MIDQISLNVGEMVCYPLDPSRFMHAAIYVGRGDSPLLKELGFDYLDNLKHYVVEFGHLNETSSSKYKQQICMNEMNSSSGWQRCDLDYLDPLPAQKIVARAVSHINTTFFDRGYNLLFNNCQHFAAWARYGQRAWLRGAQEEKMLAIPRGIALGIALVVAGWTRKVLFVVAIAAFLLVSHLRAKNRKMTQRSITFEQVPPKFPPPHKFFSSHTDELLDISKYMWKHQRIGNDQAGETLSLMRQKIDRQSKHLSELEKDLKDEKEQRKRAGFSSLVPTIIGASASIIRASGFLGPGGRLY